jgi:hypothetical protein
MKRTILIVIIYTCFTFLATGQYKVTPNKPFSTLRSSPGFATINEVTGGLGLKGKSYPYSKHFVGFTSIFGYQVNGNFFAGAGTGLSFYDAGLLVPLFLDFRFAFSSGQLTPYIFADGGLLLNVSDLNTTKLFINPGAGVRYTLSKKIGVNLGAGLLSQVDGENRATFVNLKVGGVYVF